MAFLQTIHERCHSAFVVAEHGCAIGYAVNEFAHVDIWLVIFSAALLSVGTTLALTVTLDFVRRIKSQKGTN